MSGNIHQQQFFKTIVTSPNASNTVETTLK